MVTGSNSKSGRGKTHYYQCGTYHRKGVKACHRNGIYKEIVENAVLNCIIREFSILGYAGSLEEEFRKYQEHMNRENIFQLSRLQDEIKYVSKRIALTENETANNSGKKYLDELLADLNSELRNLQKQKSELESQSKMPQLTKENTEYIKSRTRNFLTTFKHIPPEEQYNLLKEFIEYITINKSDGTYKLTYKLEAPNPNDGEKEILVKRHYILVWMPSNYEINGVALRLTLAGFRNQIGLKRALILPFIPHKTIAK